MMTPVAKRAVIKEAEKKVPKVVLKVAKEESHMMYLKTYLKSSPLLRLIK